VKKCPRERIPVSLSRLTSAFSERHKNDYDRPINARYVGFLVRRVLEIRTHRVRGIHHVGLNRERLAAPAAQFGGESVLPPPSVVEVVEVAVDSGTEAPKGQQ
jgi:hypothetical protein